MADQIKNELVGEVVSPAEAEEKVTAPVNGESALTEPQADSEPSTDAADGAAMKNSESEEGTKDNGSDEPNEEKQPEKNYPVFKETPDGKRAPMLPRGDSIRKKRKPPVFANEVKLFEDDDDFDEEDGEFFPMTTASTAGAVVSGTDASDIKTSKGKKKRKNKKASTTDAAEIDSSDDLSTVDTPILVADAGAQRAPASDVAEPMPISVVEPVAAPVMESPATSTVSTRPVDPGIEEANILLADNRAAREERKRIKAARKAASAPELDVAPVAVEVNNNVDTTDLAEDITPITVIDNGASVTPAAAPVAVKTKKEKPVDPGKAEAAALLADDKAERQRRKEMKALKAASKAAAPEAEAAPVDVTNDDVAVVVPVAVDTTPEYADSTPAPVAEAATVAAPVAVVKTKKEKPADPGREEAAALLADDKAERQRIKELKRIKRENKYAPAGVVEPVVAPEAPVAVSAAPITDPSYYDDLIKNESALEPVAESNVSSYYDPMTDSIVRVIVQPAVSNAPVSDDPYSAAIQKKIDKKEEKAALLAIAAAEKQKAKEDKKSVAPVEEEEREYDDAEAYVAPVVVPVKAQPKAQKEFSPASYNASQQKKDDRKKSKAEKEAEREALALVYGEEKARAYAARNTEEPVAEEPMREYGDAEAYVAPVVVPVKAQSKAQKEFSPASYDSAQQKKADKKDSKSDKKAEREALALVYGEEKARAYAARNTEEPVAEEPMREYGDAEAYVAPVVVPVKAQHKAQKEFSPASYDSAQQKKADKKDSKSNKKAEREALALVYGEEKARAYAARNTSTEAPVAEPMREYSDIDPYVVPVSAAAPKAAAPKAKKEFSANAYENEIQKIINHKQAKSDKKAEQTALLAVAAAEKQKSKEDKARAKAMINTEVAHAPEVVYGDAGAYTVPVKAAQTQTAAPKAKKEFSTDSFDSAMQKSYNKSVAKSDKKAEQAALLAVAAAEKQKAKEDKALEKALKAQSKEKEAAPIPVYADTEAYVAPKQEAPVAKTEEPKPVKEISTSAYDKKTDRKHNKAATAAALVAFYNGNKSAPVVAKEEPAPAPVNETVYSDGNYDVGYDPDWRSKEKAAKAQEKNAAKEARRLERSDAKAASLEKRDAKYQGKYASHEEKLLTEAEQRDALLNTYKEEIAREKAAKAAAKAAAGVAVVKAVDEVASYDDFTETFDKEAYDRDRQAILDAEAKAKADARQAKVDAREEKAAAKEAQALASFEGALTSISAKIDKKNLKAEKKAELVSIRKQYNAEEKALEAEAKAKEEAAKAAAAAPVVKEEVLYADFTETFDRAAYDAEKQAIADAKAQAKADAKIAKAAKHEASAARAEAKIAAAYDDKNGSRVAKIEKESELLAADKAARAEAKDLSAKEKAAKAAAKAAAVVTPTEVVYDDITETFDKAAYDAEKQAIADAKAQAKADAKIAKTAKHEASAARAEAKIAAAYDDKNGSRVAKMEKESELLAVDKAARAEAKDLSAKEKAAKAAAKAAAVVTPAEVVYDDFTETFDKAAYDAEKQAIADAAAKAKTDAIQAKADKRFDKAAAKEAKIDAYYTKAVEKQVAKNDKKELKAEQKAALISTYKEDKAEAKELAAKEKAARAAEKAAAITIPAEIAYSDFTETFDKAAYDTEKQAIADAAAKAKADAKIAKAVKHEESAARAEVKIAENYDKKTGERVAKLERETELLAANSADKAEAKELAARAKLLAEAEKAANAKVVEDEVVYADFTETFDKAAYDAEKQAIADAEAKAKADAKIAKAAKHEASVARAEAKIAEDYDKKTGERIAKMEKESELLAIDKSARAEAKELSAREKAVRKAEKLIASSKRPEEIVYPDPEYVPDEFSGDLLDISLPEPGDVLEGGVPRITSVRELRRARKEDQELRLLVKKSKKHLKKAEFDIETIELAEKYVDDGALEMADTKTVVKDAKLFKREEKDLAAVKELESSLENKEMLYFEQDYKNKQRTNKRRLNKAKKYGKFMLEYGSTYDPEWDGDFNNYGLPEIHPFTQGVKLPGSRRRTPKKEKLSYFNQKNLNELSREQCKTDIQMIESRVEFDYTALDIEVATVEQEFSGEYRSKKEKRWLRDSREKLKNFKAKLASAVKFEKLDNERYYSVVATDFARVELPAKADRDELIAMREELMRLLDIRDDINAELLELYSGKENGMKGSTKGRAKATLKARKRAHRRLMRYYNAICKHRVTRNEKMRIFDKMDEIVELKGDIARANYILRKEKPTGKVKRDYIRERKLAKRDVRILKKSVERSTIKALKRARKLERQRRVMFVSYAFVVAVLLFVLAMMVMGPQILEASKTFLPENLHEYIDLILNEWPKK